MQKPNHILVIRLSALGDVAMIVPVLRMVTKTYPELVLTVVSRIFYKPLFNDIPNVKFLEADVYGKHKGLGLRNLAKEATDLGIDGVADLHNVIRSRLLTTFLGLKGVTKAVIDKNRAEKKALTRLDGKTLNPLRPMHQCYADVFAELGYPIQLDQTAILDRKKLNPRLSTLIGDMPKKCIGIAPFAAYKSKMYPMELMLEVITSLDKLGTFRILLFGGGTEEIEQLNELCNSFPSASCIAGALSFEEELELISNLDVMLSMDSGNGHLAAIYGIPVVTLWGVTHPAAGFAPFGQPESNSLLSDRKSYPKIPTSIYGRKYPKDYENVMHTIAPKTVIKKILEVI